MKKRTVVELEELRERLREAEETLSAMNCQCFNLDDAECDEVAATDSRLTRTPECPP